MTEPSLDPIRVLVADDHALIREGVRALLESTDGVVLVGEADDGVVAVARVAETRPDVVLMDLNMGGRDGIEATRTITERHPDVAVVILSMLDDDAAVFAALRAGARGYVLKGADPEQLRRAIVSAASGEAVFGAGIAERVLDLLSTPPPVDAAPAFPELTSREREVLDELAKGHTNPTIARTLGVSSRTVANYVSSILNKLHSTDRTQVALRARAAGLGSDTPPGT